MHARCCHAVWIGNEAKVLLSVYHMVWLVNAEERQSPHTPISHTAMIAMTPMTAISVHGGEDPGVPKVDGQPLLGARVRVRPRQPRRPHGVRPGTCRRSSRAARRPPHPAPCREGARAREWESRVAGPIVESRVGEWGGSVALARQLGDGALAAKEAEDTFESSSKSGSGSKCALPTTSIIPSRRARADDSLSQASGDSKGTLGANH